MNQKRTRVATLAFVVSIMHAAAAQEDPGAVGPLPVTVADYTGADLEFDDFSSEVLARVYRPTNLTNGPFPLVLFLHGQQYPCFEAATGNGRLDWDCDSAGLAKYPSYLGYGYVATTLASHGMIVISISANGINAADENLGGLHNEERAELIQHHIAKWATFNSTGGAPFGTTFVGKVDLQRIATVGHSRGGQAVLNHASETPSGLRAVMAIAPTGTGTFTPISNLPLAILLGYCDGDKGELNGLNYVDRARYADLADGTNKYTILGLGANHNYFNSNWGPSFIAGEDDWDVSDSHCSVSSGQRLDELQQQGFGRAYIAAFLRRHLQDATQFAGVLNGDALPPPSAQTTDVFVGYLPGANDRKDLNRLVTETTNNTLNGSVSTSGSLTATLCGSSLRCVANTTRPTHWPASPVGARLSGVLIEWTSSGTYSNALPMFTRDVSNFATLQFRVAVDYTDVDNDPTQPQDFAIRLLDTAGRSSTVRAGDYSEALYYPPGSGNNRAAVMNTLRVPLEAFGNIDRTSLASVDLVSDPASKGRIVVSDIAFADEGISVAEAWVVSNGQ